MQGIYRRCKEEIQTRLSQAQFISFMTDIWTSTNSNESFISFTGHWLTPEFVLAHAVLCVQHFPAKHTVQNIAEMLTKMKTDWNIHDDKCYLLIRDNGANIVKGVNDGGFGNEARFVHTLQLVIGDAINSQRAIHNMIAVARRIVTHFNHSSAACTRLKEL